MAERLKPILERIIGHEQKAYISGKFIGDVTRTTYDFFQYTKQNNLPGMILLIDFQKAFDSSVIYFSRANSGSLWFWAQLQEMD